MGKRRRGLRISTAVAVVIAPAAVGIAAETGSADAATCTNGYFYGTAGWFNTGNTIGARTTLTVVSGSSVDPFAVNPIKDVGQTIWQGTGGASGLEHWVEIGYRYGIADDADDIWQLHWYWAEKKSSDGSYHYHGINNQIVVGNSYPISIVKSGSNWVLSLGSPVTWTFTETGNGGASYSRETGIEAHNSCDQLDQAYSGTLGYVSQFGVWVDNWNGSYIQPPDAPVHASWYTQYQKVQGHMN